jgi:hypothetical protein
MITEKKREYDKRYRESHREKYRDLSRRYYESHREQRIQYEIKRQSRLEPQVFSVVPNRCFFNDEYCYGPLQSDHKNGDGKNDRQEKTGCVKRCIKES